MGDNLCSMDTIGGGEPSVTWEQQHAHRIGKEVQRLRKAINLTAQQLGGRAEQLGLKMTRQAISDLENGRRRYVTTAELIVLAAALNTSPVALVYPGPYQSPVEILPGRNAGEFNAAEWFSGVYSYLGDDGPGAPEDPVEQWRANTETLRLWRELDELMITQAQMDNPEYLAVLSRQIKAISERLGIKIPTNDLRIGLGEKPTTDVSDA